MDSKRTFYWLSLIYGICVTLFLLVVFIPKYVGLLISDGIKTLTDIPPAFLHWYDNPTAFFFTYLIGYALIWWKPVWGSVLIIAGSLLFFIFNPNNPFNFLFVLPAFMVAVFYIIYTIIKWKNTDTED